LPYSIFSEIKNYNIYKIYDGLILDKDVARALNNIFKLDIIPIFIKKININIYIILYIIKYLAFKEFGTIEQIDNSRYLVIKNSNLIEIII
jgi:hypothetical protein